MHKLPKFSRSSNSRRRAHFFEAATDLHIELTQAHTERKVITFLNNLEKCLEQARIQIAEHKIISGIFDYWMCVYPDIFRDNRIRHPNIFIVGHSRTTPKWQFTETKLDWGDNKSWLDYLESHYPGPYDIQEAPRCPVLYSPDSHAIRLTQEAYADLCIGMADDIHSILYIVKEPLEFHGSRELKSLYTEHVVQLLASQVYIGYCFFEDSDIELYQDWKRLVDKEVKRVSLDDDNDVCRTKLVQLPYDYSSSTFLTSVGYLRLKNGATLGVSADEADGLTHYLISMSPDSANQGIADAIRKIAQALIAHEMNSVNPPSVRLRTDWLRGAGMIDGAELNHITTSLQPVWTGVGYDPDADLSLKEATMSNIGNSDHSNNT